MTGRVKKMKLEIATPTTISSDDNEDDDYSSSNACDESIICLGTFKRKDNDRDKEPPQTDANVKKEAGEKQDGGIEEIEDVPIKMEWDEVDILSQTQKIEPWVAQNVKELFDEDYSIPFIARFRKDKNNSMTPEKLREVKESYRELKLVQNKAKTMIDSLTKKGVLTDELKSSILSCITMRELEHISTTWKLGRVTLADKARSLGLEATAELLLYGTEEISPTELLEYDVEGKRTQKELERSLVHIISDILNKSKEFIDFIRKEILVSDFYLNCTKYEKPEKKSSNTTNVKKEGSIKEENDEVEGRQVENDIKPLINKASNSKYNPDALDTKENIMVLKEKPVEEWKYEKYFNLSRSVRVLQEHQVLAINRGEKLKVLNVNILPQTPLQYRIKEFCQRHWFSKGLQYEFRLYMLERSLNYTYNKKIFPFVIKHVRTELTEKAEKAAVDVFAKNLKMILLTPPFPGKVVMGIDPGRDGIKVAIISCTGEVLYTGLADFLRKSRYRGPLSTHPNMIKLKDTMISYGCEIVALGSGNASREVEAELNSLVQHRFFHPLVLKFATVNAQGISVYSCSLEATKELHDIPEMYISAVILARRLQDPLAEYVKVEPRHLGVGMYQHDIPSNKLQSALDEVMMECVSYVGVDLNRASLFVLRRIAGLNATKAQSIIDWRKANGPFKNREQLKLVKGIGPKTYEQCAGFVRILPETSQVRSSNELPDVKVKIEAGKKQVTVPEDHNPLDQTWIHPESYSIATELMSKCGLSDKEIGTQRFINKVKETVRSKGIGALSTELGVSEPALTTIVEGLQQPLDHDFRNSFQKPLFRQGLVNFAKLQVNDTLTGRVDNVTPFGAFVDVGVGISGFIDTGTTKQHKICVGDKIKVYVKRIQRERKQISLGFISKLKFT